MKTPLVTRIAGLFMISTLIALMISCGVQLSHAVTQGRKNSLGTVAYTENPFIYNVGAVLEGRANGNSDLLLKFSPLGTYSEFSEYIQFCGFPHEMFEGKKNPVVLTYSRQAHRIIDGRGCHQLIRVDNMEGR